jgi:hypothetical protein
MERRKLPRSNISTLIKLAEGNLIHFGITVNISKSGILCIVSAAQLSSGPLMLSLRLNNKSKPISIEAGPIWQQPVGGGRIKVGFCFSSVEEPAMHSIAEFVAGDYAKRHTGQAY